MSKIEVAKLGLSKMAGRSGLVLRKFGPDIMIFVGIGGVIGSTVMACNATLKAEIKSITARFAAGSTSHTGVSSAIGHGIR